VAPCACSLYRHVLEYKHSLMYGGCEKLDLRIKWERVQYMRGFRSLFVDSRHAIIHLSSSTSISEIGNRKSKIENRKSGRTNVTCPRLQQKKKVEKASPWTLRPILLLLAFSSVSPMSQRTHRSDAMRCGSLLAWTALPLSRFAVHPHLHLHLHRASITS
jgi:hypothetical protein